MSTGALGRLGQMAAGHLRRINRSEGVNKGDGKTY